MRKWNVRFCVTLTYSETIEAETKQEAEAIVRNAKREEFDEIDEEVSFGDTVEWIDPKEVLKKYREINNADPK